MKIAYRLVIILELLVLLSIGVTGVISYHIGTDSILERTEAQLESVSMLKTNQLNYFVQERIAEMEFVSNYCNKLLQEEYDRNFVRENLKEKLNEYSAFFEFLIIDLNGEIDISTDQMQEGKVKSSETYFIEGKESTAIQSFYYDVSLQQPAITVASPIKDDDGNTINVVAGRIDVTQVSMIMNERSGLGETGETYLVNKFNFAVTALINEESGLLKKVISTEAVTKCLEEKPQNVQFMSGYLDYVGNTVIGTFVFLPELDVCLIAEIDEEEAFVPMNIFKNNLIFYSFIAACLAFVIGYFATKTATKQVKILDGVTKKISEGDLNVAINVTSKDEIGSLAKSFNTMKNSLKITRDGLLKSQRDLEKKVNERTKELADSKGKIELQNIELKRLDRIKSEFLNVTSHELRTPLTGIKGYIQMLMKQSLGEITEGQKKALEVVLRNTDRLDHLVQDILDISQLQSKTMKFKFQQTDLGKLVYEIIESIKPSADLKKIKINSEVGDCLPELFIDNDRIKQVMMNLVNNAIKFSPDGSIINVRVKNGKNQVMIEVQDFGRGIPKNKEKKVFETFYQADSGMDRKFGGVGLGLTISQEIVFVHGGEIWVESRVGEGSTFRFTLPIKSGKGFEDKIKEIDVFLEKNNQKDNGK